MESNLYLKQELANHFQPLISKRISQLSLLIQQHFEIDYCISSTEWLGEFSLNQAFHNIVLLEVKKEFLSDVFSLIRDNFERETYLNPNKKVFSLYVSSAISPIVLKPLPNQSLIKKVSNLKVSSLEKMLVNLFVDKQIFYAYQGREMVYIFEKAIRLF